MYTPIGNHILVQLMHIKDSHFIRIMPVVHSKDYIEEAGALYAGGWLNDDIVVLHNCAVHYDRLITNIVYKKFPKFNFNRYNSKKSLWQVNAKNFDDVQTWYHEELIPYLRAKLHSYFEDSMDAECDEIDLVQEAAKLPAESLVDFSDCIKIVATEENNNKITAFELTNLEWDSQSNQYIFTMRDFIAILFHAYCYIGTIIQPLLGHSMKEVLFDKCKFTGTFSYNSHTFSIEEINYIVQKAFGKSYSLMSSRFPTYEAFIKHTIHKDLSYSSSPCTLNASLVEDNGMVSSYSPCDWDAPDTSTWRDAQGNLSFISSSHKEFIQIIEHATKGGMVSAVDYKYNVLKWSNEFKQKSAATAPLKQSLYRNTITSKVQFLDRPVKLLEEFELISDVEMKTKLGASFLDRLDEITQDNVVDIMDDLRKLTDIISTMFGIHVSDNKNCDLQRDLTAKYVDNFKDDSAETIASDVYEKVHAFLSAFMQNSKINKNQIGQDIVEMGVKKTRKARGYVYSIANPSQQELRSFTCSNLVKSY